MVTSGATILCTARLNAVELPRRLSQIKLNVCIDHPHFATMTKLWSRIAFQGDQCSSGWCLKGSLLRTGMLRTIDAEKDRCWERSMLKARQIDEWQHQYWFKMAPQMADAIWAQMIWAQTSPVLQVSTERISKTKCCCWTFESVRTIVSLSKEN